MNLEANYLLEIPEVLYHKASPANRESIRKNGLKAQIGDSYKAHWEGSNLAMTKCVFLYDKANKEYDTTYDDDIWQIACTKLDITRFAPDPDRMMFEQGCFTYKNDIPSSALNLVYHGTGESK